jgi:hypothetical protein
MIKKILSIIFCTYAQLSVSADKEAALSKVLASLGQQKSVSSSLELPTEEQPPLCCLFKSLSISQDEKKAATAVSSSSKELPSIVRPVPRRALSACQMPPTPQFGSVNFKQSSQSQVLTANFSLFDLPTMALRQAPEKLPHEMVPLHLFQCAKMPAAPSIKPLSSACACSSEATSSMMAFDIPILDLGQACQDLPQQSASRNLFQREIVQVRDRQRFAILNKISNATYELKNNFSKKRTIRHDD